MTTLAWRRRAEAEPPGAAAASDTPVWPVLAELELTIHAGRVRGWIAPEGERTSDWVNRGAEIELIGPVEEVPSATTGIIAQPDRDASRRRYATSDVLFAVPPDLPVGRHLRLHRRIHGIHFEIGEYEIHGRIHVRPGAEVGDYLLRSSRVFVPITEVDLVHHAEPAFRRRLPVIIVNSRHVTRLYSGTGGAVPATAGGLPTLSETPADVAGYPADPQALSAAGPMEVPNPAAVDPDAAGLPGAIHQALAELAALRVDDLVSEREFRAKRREILARL